MKKKISRIWSVGLVVILAASLLLSAAPVSAGTLGFSSETLPSTSSNILVTTAGLDIVDLAVSGDGTTMYAATAGVDNKIYKSTDGGRTWSGLTAPTIAAVNLVAVAPDDPSIVVIFGGVGTNLVAFASTDSGGNWSSLGTVQDVATAPATQIWDIAVSPPDGSKHYIAAAGIDAGGPALYWEALREGIDDLKYIQHLERLIQTAQIGPGRKVAATEAAALLTSLAGSIDVEKLQHDCAFLECQWERSGRDEDGARWAGGRFQLPNGWTFERYDEARRAIADMIARLSQ